MFASKTSARTLSLAMLAGLFAVSAMRCGGDVTCLRNSDCPSNQECSVGQCKIPVSNTPPKDAGTDAPKDASGDARPDSGHDSGDGSSGAAGAGSGGGGEGGASGQ